MKVIGQVTSLSPFVAGMYPVPGITVTPDTETHQTIGSQSANFTATFNQTVNVSWYINGSRINYTSLVTSTYYFNNTPSTGTWNITVVGNNTNGSVSKRWIWTVRPKTYYTGNRIWDGSKEMSSTYTWDVYSFSGFYYNLDDNLGKESLTIKNIGKSGRSIKENDITYSTSPEEVNFEHSDFGRYQVIGFMADKYFAGYTTSSKPSDNKTKSTIGSSQLHRVLLDDDDKRTVSEGGTLTLKDGYVLKITAVDIGAGTGQVWITLLKDGSEVDTDVVAGNEDYYYTKKVGSVSDLPVIAVHFDSVFRGREVNAVFIRGTFQISESYTQVKSGSKYGVMEIDSASSNEITMKNSNTVDLSAGNTIDLMGNLKIKVADNSSVLRFGLTVETTGTFEARGTIYNRTDKWTPMNFGLNIGGTSIGFYYDMDEDIGNETLWIDGETVSGTSLQSGKLKYSTNPQEVSFEHSGFGRYQVIGFMAEKYFAGYTTGSKPSGNNAKSTIGSSQLHRVLLDDNEKRTVSEGGTLTLKEGYVLKITAVDIGAGAGQVWITLLKDGSEVDSDVVAGNEDYYYTRKVGSVSDLPVIAVHFDSVFRGREVNAVFIRGVFQISESYTQVKSGNKYGAMEVTGASSSGITMENDNTIDLSQGSTSDVMGNITFRVADSGDLRFYPFVMVTSGMIANQLVIDAPAKVMAGDNITIKVNAGGNPVDNASISLDSDIGNTDKNGILNYTLPKTLKGMYNITATKLGYEKAVKTIEIEKYIDLRLSLDIPAKANQFETLTILVKYNSTAVGGAAVKYDNETIGTTDSSGALNYTPQTSGTHTISASKSGYITVIRDIEVIAPFSEYKALDINITPDFVYPGQKVVIRSNITNAGTKADTLPVDLIINGSVVGNRSVALGPHETKEINFTGKLKEWVLDEVKPGNYTVEILGQKTTIPVKEEPLNRFLVAGIITILGAVLIFIMTSKEIISIGALKAKLKMAPATDKPVINTDAINRAIKGITSKFQKK
jgi:S-layer protein (TIGR01567 family)